jgi:guanylate kinase
MSAKCYVIVGPTGAGKTTLIQELRKGNGIYLQKSVTERPMRPGEIEGDEYYFVTPEQFQKKVADGTITEKTFYHTWHGIYASEIEKCKKLLHNGINIIAALDDHGVDEMKKFYGDENVKAIFVTSAIDVLEDRMRKRDPNISNDEVQKRLDIALEQEASALEKGYEIFWNDSDLSSFVHDVKSYILLK